VVNSSYFLALGILVNGDLSRDGSYHEVVLDENEVANVSLLLVMLNDGVELEVGEVDLEESGCCFLLVPHQNYCVWNLLFLGVLNPEYV